MAQEQIGVEREFKKTVSYAKILEEAYWEPFKTFDEWPLDEVRRKCIESLRERFYVESSWQAEWAEARIRAIATQEEDMTARGSWSELLSWYIFRQKHADSQLANRALEFAINFAKENNYGWFYLREVSKQVAGRLKDSPHLYWYVPSMREFMIMLLSERQSGASIDSDWDYYVNRAVLSIVNVGDIELLPQIEKVLSTLETREQLELLKPSRMNEKFALVQHKAVLQEAIRVLTKERARQMPDINITFGSYLREKAGLVGSVIPRLHYPERVPAEKAKERVEIRLELELTRPEEKEKLLLVLKDYTVEFCGEGFIPESYFSSQVQGTFTGLSCRISAQPTRGINRFSLRLVEHEGTEEKSSTEEVFGYIYVE